MEYSIQALSRLSGVTTRTLRWYDQIGLLKPSRVAESGYRYYGGAEVDRLQDILYYRALGVELARIKECLDDPSFDRLAVLSRHLAALEAKREHLEQLIQSVKDTIRAEERKEFMQDREEKTEQQLQESIKAADEQPILISDACKQLNMEAHVLRYWEEELGLPIMRNDQGYRCYTNAQLLMFQRIKILRDAGYQLKAIKLVVPRLALLDDDEFYYLVKLSDEMNKRASELPDTLPAILPVSASQTELARKLRMEEFEDVMNRILDEALCRHSADVNAQLADTICEKIGVQLDNVIAEKITEQVSTKVIKEMDYRMRLQDDEAEERFRKLDETLFMRRKKSREQKEAAASRLPWKRKHKT